MSAHATVTGGRRYPGRLTPGRIRAFRRTVYGHYRAHGRHDLPWRHTSDPYRIFVSEVMLQQTQVPRVTAKYREFTQRFPSWRALAGASLADVLAVWQGLGYNRRARFLREAARAVVREYGGRLPREPEALQRLPGIGPATAASIAAFAFDRPTVFIETNVRSVFIHHFFPGWPAVSDDEVRPLVEQTLDRRSPRRWYSALMDYGTGLRKRVANPSRRSSHHVRQSRFEGSDRQARGRVLRAVLARPGLGVAALRKATGVSGARFRRVLTGLCDDGMVACREGRVRVAVS